MKAENFRNYMKTDYSKVLEHSDQVKGKPKPFIQKEFAENTQWIALPSPEKTKLHKKSFFDLVDQRRSRRKFSSADLTLEELSFLLWSTQGIREVVNDSSGNPAYTFRTCPSAGSRHAFETYLAIFRVEGIPQGIYRYDAIHHQIGLEFHTDNLSHELSEICLGQQFCGSCSVNFIWSVIPYRCEWRYPATAHKVLLLDIGHVCQNLYLACEELELGTCAVAAYNQESLDKLLKLDGNDEFTIYLSPVGKIENKNS